MEKTSLEDLFQSARNNPELVTIETTIASGLEKVASDECIETFGSHTPIYSSRGKIYFNIPKTNVFMVLKMRSIDNVYIVVHLSNLEFVWNKTEDLLILKKQYSEISWRKALDVWKDVFQFSGILYPSIEEYEAYLDYFVAVNSNNPKKCKGEKKRRANCTNELYSIVGEGIEAKLVYLHSHGGVLCDTGYESHLFNDDSLEEEVEEGNDEVEQYTSVPKFRVSAKRIGTHSFSSGDIAKTFGALIQEDLFWIVDLNNFDVEIMTTTNDSELIVSISLTKYSLHRRNLIVFGLTSLRATISYSLIKLAQPIVGDIVIDPLAGSGSIPLEGALAFSESYFLAGDNCERACNVCDKNFKSVLASEEKSLPANILLWNAIHLPLKNSSVDIIVTDLPFGKRSGSKHSNKVLYPRLLKEFARVVRTESGRAVLLTADKRNFEIAQSMMQHMWKLADRRFVNVGGLRAVVFILLRSIIDYDFCMS